MADKFALKPKEYSDIFDDIEDKAMPDPPLIILSGVLPDALDEYNSTSSIPVDKKGMVFDILNLKLWDVESSAGVIFIPKVGWVIAMPVLDVVWFKPYEESIFTCWLWIKLEYLPGCIYRQKGTS